MMSLFRFCIDHKDYLTHNYLSSEKQRPLVGIDIFISLRYVARGGLYRPTTSTINNRLFLHFFQAKVGSSWSSITLKNNMETYHTLPVNDIAGHDESENCPCKPRIVLIGNGKLVIHNSWDGREAFEMKETKT